MEMSKNDRYASSPMHLGYVKILRCVMWTIASWPGKELGDTAWESSKYYLYYLHIQALFAFMAGFLYLVHQAKKIPFVILGHTCITLLISFTSTAKISLLSLRKKYKIFSKVFFLKMHLFYMKDKSDYAMKTYISVHRLSKLCTFYLTAILCATIVFFNVGPIYVNFAEGLYTQGIPENSTKVFALAVYYRFPFDLDYTYLTNFWPYLIVSVYTWNISYFCGSFLTILDLYLYIIVFHIWGHFKILTHDLKSIPRPAVDARKTIEEILLEKYSVEESQYVNKKLKECIDYHRVIVDFTKMMSDVFGPTLFVYTGFMLVVSCLLLLECSYMNMEAFFRYGPLTLMVFQELIQFGLVFELIGTASENLKIVVYDLPWECMDCTNRKTVLLLLMNVQKPMRVKALGVTDMGVATVAGIIKTSVSYFTFLRTID